MKVHPPKLVAPRAPLPRPGSQGALPSRLLLSPSWLSVVEPTVSAALAVLPRTTPSALLQPPASLLSPPFLLTPLPVLLPCAETNRQLSSPAAGRGTAGEALCSHGDSCAQLVGALPTPHHASCQVAHSCRQITPLLAAGSSPFPRLFPLWLRWFLFLCFAAPHPPPKLT